MPSNSQIGDPVRRSTLRLDVRDRLRSIIVSGGLPAGSNVAERDLSVALGISRTPLREALLGLEAEGLLRAEPQRGFFVTELSFDGVRETYSLIATLEAFAIREGQPTPSSALVAINRRLREARDAKAAVSADSDWHRELVRCCCLPRTADHLDALRAAAARYEYRFFTGSRRLAASAAQHERIRRALVAHDFVAAEQLIADNWLRGRRWIERRFARTQV